jgi:hypothetical protein
MVSAVATFTAMGLWVFHDGILWFVLEVPVLFVAGVLGWRIASAVVD